VFTNKSFSLGQSNEIEVLAIGNPTSTAGLSLSGNAFNNIILGGAGNDYIDGGTGSGNSGSDTLYGFGGNDSFTVGTNGYIDGGSGQDSILVWLRQDVTPRSIDLTSGLTGSVFALTGTYVIDVEAITIALGSANDTVWGSSGRDQLQGFGGNDFLVGGDGADFIDGGLGNDYLVGGAGNDSLVSSLGNNTMVGGDGDDTISGGDGVDTSYGGNGNDLFIHDGNTFRAFIDGGDGIDTVSFRSFVQTPLSLDFTSGLTAPLFALLGSFIVDVEALNLVVGNGNNTIWGGAFNDILTGGNGQDFFVGGAGADSLVGGNGNDYLVGGLGNDVLNGDWNEDVLQGDEGDDSLNGGQGNDTLVGGLGADAMAGGDGNDYYYVDASGDSVTEGAVGGVDVVFASANWSASFGSAIEVIAAYDQSSTIGLSLGGSGDFANQISGTAGNDTISTGISASSGTFQDSLYGYGGDDVYYIDGYGAGVYEQAGQGSDTIYASRNFSLSTGSQVEVIASSATSSGIIIYGNELNNIIIGNGFVDSFVGGAGNDTLYGYDANDYLQGQMGDDFVYGGDGDDVIIGGRGADALYGGAGSDEFKFGLASASLFTAKDVIYDFVSGVDKLDFRVRFDPEEFLLTPKFTVGTIQAGSVNYLQIIAGTAGADHHVLGDVNADGIADFEILIANNGSNAPVASDFLV
jgi:Ca2+-binding RTX toxin-like protein